MIILVARQTDWTKAGWQEEILYIFGATILSDGSEGVLDAHNGY